MKSLFVYIITAVTEHAEICEVFYERKWAIRFVRNVFPHNGGWQKQNQNTWFLMNREGITRWTLCKLRRKVVRKDLVPRASYKVSHCKFEAMIERRIQNEKVKKINSKKND